MCEEVKHIESRSLVVDVGHEKFTTLQSYELQIGDGLTSFSRQAQGRSYYRTCLNTPLSSHGERRAQRSAHPRRMAFITSTCKITLAFVHPSRLKMISLILRLLHHIRLPNPPLHRRPRGNPIHPLEQMRERLHLLLRKPTPLPPFHPRPRLHVRQTILTLPFTRQILPRRAIFAIFPAELNLQHAVHAQRLVLEAVDGVFDLLGRGAREVVRLALVGGAGAVPEEDPLQALGALELCTKMCVRAGLMSDLRV